MTQMMECGHSANAKDENGNPVCAICAGIHVHASKTSEEPSLEGRMAACHCKRKRPSSTNLPFFRFMGEDSYSALNMCKNCPYAKKAHENVPDKTCSEFTPHGAYKYDQYYCGCMGWD